MRSKDGVVAAALIGLAILVAQVAAQAPPPPPAPPEGGAQAPAQGRGGRVGRAGGPPGAPAGGGGQRGAVFPAQQRAAGDPAVIARGKTLYGINCQSCHGVDLRGGDQGGPNLLRSQVVLSDKAGELIVPIIHGSRQNMGMDPINLSDDDASAVAEFLHSVAATMQGQGGPPRGNPVPPNEAVLVGSAMAGQTYFASKCSSCHSVTGDLKGIGGRYTDARMLQNNWVGGGEGGGRGGGGAGNSKPVTVTVTPAAGTNVEGRLVRIDDFIVILEQADNSQRSFRRNGDVPKVEIHDPLEAHKMLLTVLNDKDMHDVTAYLASIK
jgi:cytochrome c oxidase cbb3-type subunit 3